MKLPLLATALLLLAPAALSAAEPSPVGTWEITLSGAEQGLAFATFEEDKDLIGYGLSDEAPGLFTLTGTWDIDEKGKLTGSYLREADGEFVTGTLTARLTDRRIIGSIAAENGNFKFKARPQGTLPNLTGDWDGIATQNRVSLPQSYTIIPARRVRHHRPGTTSGVGCIQHHRHRADPVVRQGSDPDDQRLP